MTSAQKRIVIAVTILVAITRWWAMSATLWDWDEALFSAGVRSFDVVTHHPHPPGFPLYVLAGKAVNLLVHDEFRALQLVNLAAAVLLFPLLVLMALAVGFTFPVALGGSLICVFAPNVWFFGGTAFSDIPSLALVLGACAVLFRSRTAGPAMFLGGALILGLAAGVRSQNLLVGLVPFVLAAREQLRTSRWRTVAAGALITATLTIGSYIGAGLASSSWSDYQWTLRQHRQYILSKDMIGSPTRPPLHDVTDDFFVRDFGFFRAGLVIVGLSIVSLSNGLVRRNRPPILLLLTFGPFAVVAWLVLDYHSASRFSIGYLPLFAILAADGLEVLSRFLLRDRWRGAAVVAASTLIAAALVVWAAPAVNEARTKVTPTMEAVRWIRANLSPQEVTLYVTDALIRMAGHLLPEYRIIRVLDERVMAMPESAASRGYVLAEGATDEPSGLNFLRSRKSRLWRIARPRYFEVSIVPLARRAQFLDGWHELENIGAETWRWMGRRSVTILPAQPPPAELTLTLAVPLDAIPIPVISLWINGRLLDQLRGSENQIERSYVVNDSRHSAPNELVIETDQWVNPKMKGISPDPRDLGLRLQDMSWGPARPQSSHRR